MKKFLLLCFLLFPGCVFAQLSVSAVTGESGYTAARGSFTYAYQDFTFIPTYSYYKDTDDTPSTSRYGLRVEYQPGRIAFGAEGGYVPKKEGYTNYSAGADIKYYIIGRTRTTVEMFYIGAGATYIHHEQDPGFLDAGGTPIASYELDETRTNFMAGITVKPVVFKTIYSKGHFSDTPPAVGNIWLDIPYFITVNRAFNDYYWDSYAILPTEYFDLHASYSLSKDYWAAKEYQSVSGGATVKLWGVSVTGRVEVRDIDSSADRRTYYSLSSSLYFK